MVTLSKTPRSSARKRPPFLVRPPQCLDRPCTYSVPLCSGWKQPYTYAGSHAVGFVQSFKWQDEADVSGALKHQCRGEYPCFHCVLAMATLMELVFPLVTTKEPSLGSGQNTVREHIRLYVLLWLALQLHNFFPSLYALFARKHVTKFLFICLSYKVTLSLGFVI